MSAATPSPHPTSHAGGVVFRRLDGRNEYLLIRARQPPDAWVFPKGHIERGESAEAAAVREVLEESGIHATIVADLGRLSFDHGAAAMFLMVARDAERAPAERDLLWLPLDWALETLSFQESRDVLRTADALVRAQP